MVHKLIEKKERFFFTSFEQNCQAANGEAETRSLCSYLADGHSVNMSKNKDLEFELAKGTLNAAGVERGGCVHVPCV